MSTQPGPQAAALGQQVPEPTFASVRVEFADGSFREFHVHRPLRAEVEIAAPGYGLPLTADLGMLPVGVMPPSLPKVEVRLRAGIDPRHPVLTMDSRTADPAGIIGRMLALLSAAAELRRMYGNDGPEEAWHGWERTAEAFLAGLGDDPSPADLVVAMARYQDGRAHR